MGLKAQIFLSYTGKDSNRVESLYNTLFEAGLKPWMDKKDIVGGEVWENVTLNAIKNADFFLACLSKNSVNKRGFLQTEIRSALDIFDEGVPGDIYLIPVRLEECKIPEHLSHFHYIDLHLDNGFDLLVKAIRKGVERYKAESNKKTSPSLISKNSEKEFLTKKEPYVYVSYSLFEQDEFVEEFVPKIEDTLSGEFGWPDERVFVATFILRELADNAFEHGCEGKGELKVHIELRVEVEGSRLVSRVISPGDGFNFIDVLNHAEKISIRKIRGRGLWFVDQIADKLIASSNGLIIQATILRESHNPIKMIRQLRSSTDFEKLKKERIPIVPIKGHLHGGVSTLPILTHVDNLLEEPIAGVIFDLKTLERIDSSGIGVIINIHNKCSKAGIYSAWINLPVRIKKLFSMTRIDQQLHVLDNIEEAKLAITNRKDKETIQEHHR